MPEEREQPGGYGTTRDLDPLSPSSEALTETTGSPSAAVPRRDSISKEGKKRLRTNVVATLAYYVFSTLVGVWYTPYLISHLGVEVYGLVPLALQMVSYFQSLANALTQASSRFVTLHLERGELTEANRTFNTTLFTTIGMGGLLYPLGIVFIIFAPQLIHIPAGYETDARIIFGAVLLSSYSTVIGMSFGVSLFVRSRFDVVSFIDTVVRVLPIACVVMLFSIMEPRLWHVAIGVLAVAIFRWFIRFWMLRTYTPELRVRRADFDRGRLREIMGMGGWMLVRNLGEAFYQGGDLLIMNAVVGALAAGLYAPLAQWVALLRTMALQMSYLLSPTIIATYAQGDERALAQICRQSVKTMGLAIALPIGLVCGLGRPLLLTWLKKPEFGDLGPQLALLLAPLCVSLAISPIMSVAVAHNKMRWPALVFLGGGLINIGLAVVMAHPRGLGMGMYGVIISQVIMLTLRDGVFYPIYTARLLHRNPLTFYPSMVPGMMMAALTYLVTLQAAAAYDLTSWLRLALCCLVIGIPLALLAFFGGLSRSERATILELARGRA